MIEGFADIDTEILGALRARGALDLVELVGVTGIPSDRLRRAVQKLVDAGQVERVSGASGPSPVYRLPRTLRIERPLANSG